jgi:hypothetical protein
VFEIGTLMQRMLRNTDKKQIRLNPRLKIRVIRVPFFAININPTKCQTLNLTAESP